MGRLTVTPYIEVRNLYDATNPAESIGYGYDYLSTDARSGLPILPIVGVAGDF